MRVLSGPTARRTPSLGVSTILAILSLLFTDLHPLERLAIPDELKAKTGTLLLGPASGQPDSGTLPWLSDPTYMSGD